MEFIKFGESLFLPTRCIEGIRIYDNVTNISTIAIYWNTPLTVHIPSTGTVFKDHVFYKSNNCTMITMHEGKDPERFIAKYLGDISR